MAQTIQTTRMMLTIPAEMSRRAEALKRECFPDESYAEMYYQLLALGLQSVQARAIGQERQDTV